MMKGMKEQMTQIAQKVLPKGAVHSLKDSYRKARVHLLSARYGQPGRRQRIIAVTGTNGKTTTCVYLNEILKASGATTALFTTAVIEMKGTKRLNDLNRTVPLTKDLFQFLAEAKKERVDFVILETTSHALEQHKLDTIDVECAVMTNLTQDHLDYHKTMEGYAKAKGILFAKTPRFVVLNRDDEWYDFYNNFDAGEEKITYGVHDGADVRINQVKLYKHGSEADVVFDLQTHLELATALPGQFNVYNECAASAAAYLFHVPLQAIVDGIANVESVPGRFEFVTKDTPYDVVVDYAHTPDALEKLLDAVKGIAKNRVILVFGACGDRDQGKRPIMGKIAAERADKIYVTEEESYSEDPQAIREMILTGIKNAGGLPKTQEIPDRREAIERALTVAKPGDVVLVTGMGHEQYRVVNGEQLPWNDSEVVREIVAGQADKAQKNRVTAVQSDTKDLA